MNNLVTPQNAASILSHGAVRDVIAKGGTKNVQHEGGKTGGFDAKVAEKVVGLTKVSMLEAQSVGDAMVYSANSEITSEVANIADKEIALGNHAKLQGKEYS